MTYDAILSRFRVVRRYEDKAQCVCPAHTDRQASLTVSRGRNSTILYCHAGCNYRDILSAVGLSAKDLYYDDSKPQSGSWRAYIERREGRQIEAIYNYVDYQTGNYLYTKLRLAGKKMLYGILKDNRFRYGLDGHSRKELKGIYVPGGLGALNKAIAESRQIFIPEGEKDANTLATRGYTAMTAGGVNDWQPVFTEPLRGAEVVILADNDTPGKQLASRVLADLQGIAKSVRIVIPTPDIQKGDITDFFEAGHDNEEFEKLIATATDSTVPKGTPLNTKQHKITGLELILNRLHAERYETTDKGFGRLFAEVFKDKHRYNPSRKDFMLYDGKRWVDDTEGLAARSAAKQLSDALIKYAVGVDTDGKYLKAVTPLCNIRNRNNMLQDSRDIYYFSNEDLDQDDYILNVQNGTLDLSQAEPKFMKHSPDMLLSKICNVKYDPSASCPIWIKFLDEIMQGDKDKIQYLQKVAGLSLTGNTEQETCFILYGSTTRNGKSTFVETLIYLLGDYAVSMRPESLAVKQNLDSRQASGDIARLAGCRFVNASEPPKRMLFDTALLKSLLGRDSITARHLHQREFTFIPKFKLVMNTNYLPTITDDTVFSSGRINVISFDKHFEPEDQDKQLKNKLRAERELSGILNWCIQGLYMYRQQGFETPQAIRKATESYRADSDKIGNFISECLTKSGDNCKAKDVYEAYSKWCDENGFGTENKSNFFAELKTKNLFATSGTVGGKTVKNIVKGYTIEVDFISCEPGETLPFD